MESEGLLDCYSCRSTQCQVLVISDVLVYGKGQEGAKGTRLLKMGGGRASGLHCITGYTFPTAPFTLLRLSLLAYYNLLLTFVKVLTVHYHLSLLLRTVQALLLIWLLVFFTHNVYFSLITFLL